MTVINTVDSQRFSFNGIEYFKNFTSIVVGNKIRILNTYDSSIELTDFPTLFSDFEVDGNTYGNVADLQSALLPIIYNRTSLGFSTTTNTIIFDAGYTRTDNSFIFNADSIWDINGIENTNSINVNIVVPYSTVGNKRWVRIVLNYNNTFQLVNGDEVSENTSAIVPATPPNTIEYISFEITDSEINNNQDTIVGADYVRKSDSQGETLMISGNNVVLTMPSTGRSFINLINATSVAGFDFTGVAELYTNKRFRLYNSSANPITLIHNAAGLAQGITYFTSKDGSDVVIPTNEFIELTYSYTELREGFRSWSGGGGASNLIHYKIHWYNQTQITGSGTIDFFDGFLAIPANTLQADDKIIIRTHFGDMDDSTTSFLSHHVFSDQIRPVYNSNGLIGIGSTNRRIGGFSREIRVVSDSETKQCDPGSQVFSDFYFKGFNASYSTQNGGFFQNLFNDDTYCNLYINCPNTRKYNVIFTEIYVYRNN